MTSFSEIIRHIAGRWYIANDEESQGYLISSRASNISPTLTSFLIKLPFAMKLYCKLHNKSV